MVVVVVSDVQCVCDGSAVNEYSGRKVLLLMAVTIIVLWIMILKVEGGCEIEVEVVMGSE
ncbi:hypothetical protein TSUD_153790 [Trifolium subterraneum]|uniref:Transmembrane protein n=1 Tax=Trifolium subterraneum TaxID=3900 RepID=A0A2Z6MGC3_TRISU|nr:hypothetical protein TSUD_153790 [Trifolium subterraneum]